VFGAGSLSYYAMFDFAQAALLRAGVSAKKVAVVELFLRFCVARPFALS
jgi:uncharacterized protein (UPF0332 family)